MQELLGPNLGEYFSESYLSNKAAKEFIREHSATSITTNSDTQVASTATNATLEDHDRSNHLLVDTGFSVSAVVGDQTLRLARHKNPKRFRAALRRQSRPVRYLFGAGRAVEARRRIILLSPLLGQVLVDVVPGKLPFLVGRELMKTAKLKIDFANNSRSEAAQTSWQRIPHRHERC